MKKTLAILLAAAGMAMGAEKVENLNWIDNKAELGDFGNEVTVALTLNWVEISKLTDDSFFFKLLEEDTDKIQGMGMDVAQNSDDRYVGSWLIASNTGKDGGYVYTDAVDMQLSSDWRSAQYVTLIYTSKLGTDNKWQMNGYIHMYDELGKIKQAANGDSQDEGSKIIPSFDEINSITINPLLVGTVEIYKGTMEINEIIETSQRLVNESMGTGGNGNVPEPTTATLSLLALAGLAARRRRK